jgi:hypothetical protein
VRIIELPLLEKERVGVRIVELPLLEKERVGVRIVVPELTDLKDQLADVAAVAQDFEGDRGVVEVVLAADGELEVA